MTLDEANRLVASVPHWHHAFEIYPGLRTPGSYQPQFLLDRLSLEANLRGMRVLDIGASDGFFSREVHRRGADVVSIDYRDRHQHGFGVMEQLYGHRFDYRRANIYDLSAADLGQFDIILCLGVIYHLPDIMRAFAIIRSLARGIVLIETEADNQFCPDVAAARYYVDSTLNRDWTNFWVPNRQCVVDMLQDSGFDVVRDDSWGTRMLAEAKINSEPGRLRKIRAAYGVF